MATNYITLTCPSFFTSYICESGKTYTPNTQGAVSQSAGTISVPVGSHDLVELLGIGCTPASLIYQNHLYFSTSIISAAGTTLSSGTPVTNDTVYVSSVGAGQGVTLPYPNPGYNLSIINGGANNLSVYPNGIGDYINSSAPGSPFTIPPGQAALMETPVFGVWSAYIGNLPSGFIYNTISSTSNTTLTAANITGQLGFVEVSLNLTGAISSASTATLPTVSSFISALYNPAVGFQYKLIVINTSANNFAWTVASSAGWTLNGTMSVAQNTTRTFYVTLSSASSASLQSVGTGTYS